MSRRRKFKVGDVVRLKSHSMPMTVEAIDEDELYVVWWNPVSGDLERDTLTPEVVDLVEEKP